MVLSTSSKARNAASISNQSQGGGSKKAGLPRATNASAYQAFHEHGLPQTMATMMLPLASTVRPSRSIGMRFFR